MAVDVGVKVKLEGEDKTKESYDSAIKSNKVYESEVIKLKATWQSTVTAISTGFLAIK